MVEPPGQRDQGAVGAGDTVCDLVHGAIAAEHDDAVDAAPGGVFGQPCRVVAAGRFGNLDVVRLAQCTLNEDLCTR